VGTVTEGVGRLVARHTVAQDLVEIRVAVDGAVRVAGAAVFFFELGLAPGGLAKKSIK
jgi:hypothetical protein